MVYIQNRILFSHKKQGNTAICDNMDFEDIMLSEISQSKTNTAWSHVESTKQKSTQSLHCIPETDMLYVSYTSMKKEDKYS